MDESIATADQIDIIEGVDQSVWQKMSNILLDKGYVSEFNKNVPLPAKDILRSTQYEILLKLRLNGYDARELIYIECNVDGSNGYAFYNPDINDDRKSMLIMLSNEILATL